MKVVLTAFAFETRESGLVIAMRQSPVGQAAPAPVLETVTAGIGIVRKEYRRPHDDTRETDIMLMHTLRSMGSRHFYFEATGKTGENPLLD